MRVTENKLNKLLQRAKMIHPDPVSVTRVIKYDDEGNIIECLDNGETKKYTPKEWDKEEKDVCLVRADEKYHKFKNDKPTVIVDDIE